MNLAVVFIQLDLSQMCLDVLLQLLNVGFEPMQEYLPRLRIEIGRGRLDHRVRLLQDFQRLLGLLLLHGASRRLQPRHVGRHLFDQQLLPRGRAGQDAIVRAGKRLGRRDRQHLQMILQPLPGGRIELFLQVISLAEQPDRFIPVAVGQRHFAAAE